MGIAGAISWSLTLLMLFVFLLVVAFVVRPRQPEAATILLLGLGLELVCAIGSMVAQFLLPRLLASGGDMTTYAQAYAINTIVVALGHGAGRALLIWGVVRLAKPANIAQS